jgi:hypothetical protein
MSLGGLLADRAQQKLDAVSRLAADLGDSSLSLDDIAARCDEAAKELVGAASLLRRISKQQKRTVAAGAVANLSKQGE